jgi:hypothetical protein
MAHITVKNKDRAMLMRLFSDKGQFIFVAFKALNVEFVLHGFFSKRFFSLVMEFPTMVMQMITCATVKIAISHPSMRR